MDRRSFISVAGLTAAGALASKPETVFAESAARAEIAINYKNPLHKIPQTIYGHFIEELGKCIEGGIWRPVKGADQFLGGVPWDLVDAVMKIHPAVIRYPGGCYADSYHWQDGIGPMAQRKTKPNLAWRMWGNYIGTPVSNQFGTDEFVLFCREVGAEPMMTANVGTGKPEEAAAWVEYCNGSASSKWGSERAKNGHKEPFNVKYWFVGNEMWGAADGHFTPEKYGKRYLEFSRAMREKDPGVKLILSGWTDKANHWNQVVLETAGKDTDYLSIHSYWPLGTIYSDFVKYFMYDYVIEGVEKRIIPDLNKGIQAIEQWAPKDRDIKVTLDEWNVWFDGLELHQTDYNLRDGIFVATVLNRLQALADKAPIANIAQMVNCIGIIISDRRGTFLTPSAWAFNLYTERNLDRYLKPALAKEAKGLDVSASRDEAGGKLSIFLVNQNKDQAVNAQISLSDFAPAPQAEIATLHSKNPLAYNTFMQPEKITPKITKLDLKLQDQGGQKSFGIELPAHSINVISCSKI
jgi:alpha-N-arabinofuranosidase